MLLYKIDIYFNLIILIVKSIYWQKINKLEKIFKILESPKGTQMRNSNFDSKYFNFALNRICRILKVKKCLTKSMALFMILKNYQKKPILLIGVSETNAFSSHSWVRCEGRNYGLTRSISYKKIKQIE